jgi:hypothetical protein
MGPPWYPGYYSLHPGYVYYVLTDNGQTQMGAIRTDDGNYFCHGYTFNGSVQPGGPYNVGGGHVIGALRGDGYTEVCRGRATPADSVVFFYDSNRLSHSGKVTHVAWSGYIFDENSSTDRAKWGWDGALETRTFAADANEYGGNPGGSYRCWVKPWLLPLRMLSAERHT